MLDKRDASEGIAEDFTVRDAVFDKHQKFSAPEVQRN
jgi:hypothetical protein